MDRVGMTAVARRTTGDGVPSSDALRVPVLVALHALGGTASIEAMVAKIIAMQGYGPEVTKPIHKGSVTKLTYRLAWTRTHLKLEGLLENTGRKQWTLTQAGAAALKAAVGSTAPALAQTAPPAAPAGPSPAKATTSRSNGGTPLALDLPDPSCQAKLREVAARVRQMRARDTRISEEDTKRVLITPVVEAMGWDIFDTDEVRNEYRHATADNPVDYALFLARSPVLFIEAKPLGQALDDRRWMVQTLNYANAAGVDWCVLTNGAEYRIYKVHARGEAEKKLFQTVTLEDPDGFDDACRLLGLLTRERMRGKAIDELWEAWHIDRQVHGVLDSVLQDDRFVAMIRQRLPGVGAGDIRRSLRRANIRIDYPPMFRTLATPASGAAGIEEPSAEVAEEQGVAAPEAPRKGNGAAAKQANVARNGSAVGGQRGTLQRTADLFALGRLKAGDVLTIKGRAGSEARVVDGTTVDYRGRHMSYLAWGKAVTGWKAIQIYAWAVLPDGRILETLRT